jgi:hypothetical protein
VILNLKRQITHSERGGMGGIYFSIATGCEVAQAMAATHISLMGLKEACKKNLGISEGLLLLKQILH